MKDKNIENKVSASSENLRGTPQSAQRTEKPLKVRKNWLRTLGIILCAAALTLGIVFGVGNIFKTEDDFTIYAANAKAKSDWSNAVADSISTGEEKTVKLTASWGADSDSTYTRSFGTGTGFTVGALYVPNNAKIVLDLNGYTLSRNLSAAREYGYVIYCYGTLTIRDTSSTQLGIITGGYSSTRRTGSGIHITGVVNFEGGNITNNKFANSYGAAGVFINDGGTFNMSGGKITSNSAGNYECATGGILAFGEFAATGGTISGNSSGGDNSAGGINFYGGSPNLNNVTISNNTSTAQTGSAGGIRYTSTGLIENCTFSGNSSQCSTYGGGAMVFSSGTYSDRPTFRNCVFENNVNNNGAGVLYIVRGGKHAFE